MTRRAVFGALLKRYRRAAALTQEELAVRAGYSAVYISMIERGRRLPLPSVVRILADTLDLSVPERMLLETAARHPNDTPARPSLIGGHAAASTLIGRVAEVAALERHLAGPGPPVLLLAGEPGIGKTRLLQEAVAYGEACGWQVLQGGCGRRGGQEPYAPLLGALTAAIERLSPGQRELEGCAWLIRLLPELAAAGLEPLPPWTLPPAQERRLIANAVARFLSNVAGPAGSLLVLDDLQWAAPDALDLLAALVYTETPVRLIGAYRATEVGSSDPLADMLADLGRAALATHLTLAPLAGPEAGQLFDRLASGASVELRERVLRRAGGVPFFLVSYAQTLPVSSPARSMEEAEEAEEAVPWDVAQNVRQRVAALPSAVRTLLDVAALVGRQAPRALLVALATQTEEMTLAALAVACRSRLLEEADDTYRFVHDVIREVIEGDIGAGRRALLHRRVAEALDGMPGEPAVELLAYHYDRAGMEEQASRYLEQAGDRAREQAAHVAAAQYYREAAARLEALGRREDAARVRVQLGTLLTTAARYEDALRVLEEAAALSSAAQDPDGLGRAVAQIGHVYADQGTPEVGIQRLQTLVIPLARDGAVRGLAALNAALASLFFVAGHYDEQLAAATQAAELARTIRDSRVLLQARLSLGTALIMTGRSDDALPVLEETISVSQSLGDLDSLSRALTSAASIYINRSAFDTSMGYIDRALRVAERVGDPVRTLRALCYRGSIDLFTGQWPRARADFERALAASHEVGMSAQYAYPVFYLGFLTLCEGGWDEAASLLDDSIRIAEPIGDLQVLRWAYATRAECDLLQGYPRQARDRLAALIERTGLQGKGVAWLLLFQAWAHLELGAMARAADLAARAVVQARAEYDHFSLTDALWVQAMVMVRQERGDAAGPILDEGLALARRMPYPYTEGRLLYLSGLFHRARGEPRLARECLEAALAVFQRLGARKEVERTERRLALGPEAWMRRTDPAVTEAQWARIRALLPPVSPTGRPRADDRRTLEAILYVQCTGCAWADLPPALGDDATAHRRLAQWRAAGLWLRIEEILRDPSTDDF